MIYSVILGLLALALPISSQKCNTIRPLYPATFAPGFSGRVLANYLKAPRTIVFDAKGRLLVLESGSFGVRSLTLTDNGGTNVCVKSKQQLISDPSLNHGLALTPDGKKLFVSSQTTVWSYDYDDGAGVVSNKQTVVTGMNNGGHTTRTLVIPRAQPDSLLVQVGSAGNYDTPAAQASVGRAQVRIFNIDAIQSKAAPYTSGALLSYGIRNNVAIAEDPQGGIWSANNGLDDMEVNGVDVHNTNPCEELNYHGPITNASSSLRGASFGYPYCHSIYDPSALPPPLNATVRTGDTITNGATSTPNCARVPAKLCFPAHNAPLGLTFTGNGSAAYISFHGSWDRNPPDGYRVSRVAFDTETGMPMEMSTSQRAAQHIMYNRDNSRCPDQCFRPVGLALRGRRLFVASDETGEIWVVSGAE